jgi:biofilm protein TabA
MSFSMIFDHFTNALFYSKIHPLFSKAFDFILNQNFSTINDGKYDLEGKKNFASIETCSGKGQSGALLEIHQRYIDIQVALEGNERLGWKALETCEGPIGDYSKEKDILFYKDQPQEWLPLPQNHFAIFFPHDAHAPLAGIGLVRKLVIKIAVD